MGRTRTKTRKAPPPTTEIVQEKVNNPLPAISALIEKAQGLIVQCDYELAGRFIVRALERAPNNAEALEIQGVVQLETGDLDAAKQVSLLHVVGTKHAVTYHDLIRHSNLCFLQAPLHHHHHRLPHISISLSSAMIHKWLCSTTVQPWTYFSPS